MTPDSRDRLRASLAALAPQSQRFARDFYDRLFALEPSARALFAAPIDQQADKFMAMVEALVDGLDDPHRLRATFAEMGRRHAGYGVEESHYDAVGAALLTALHAAHGESWNEDMEIAWAEFYGELAEAMIAAAQPERPAPD